MGGEFEGEWIYRHKWPSLFTVHLKVTLLIGYSPTQNKKFKKKDFKRESVCMSREVMKLFATEFEVPLGCSGGKTHLAEADKSAK